MICRCAAAFVMLMGACLMRVCDDDMRFGVTMPVADQHPDPGMSTDLMRTERPRTWSDPLYGVVRLSAWASALLATPPFARLAGISLSDVPGEMLFGRAFPSRLDHTRGVYHLTRLARPRDRMLQAAALAHDLGHGPFSHLSEPVMRAWLGCDHEQRAAERLAAVRAALSATVLRRLAWLDWDEVAALVVGAGTGARGALLNDQLDYDNLDNVARFARAAGLSQPAYDGMALARALRLTPADTLSEGVEATGPSGEPASPTYLLAAAEVDALGWQGERRRVYDFLHDDHRNLVPHAMLRKAVELAFAAQTLPPDFLDMTDAEALASLGANTQRGTAALIARVRAAGYERHHACLWEAEIPADAAHKVLGGWRERLALEAELAAEAGLAPYEVIVEAIVSKAGRALPPLSATGRPGTFTWMPAPPQAPCLLHLFVAAGTPRDYQRRLRAAAERRLGAWGALPRSVGRAESSALDAC